MGPSRLSRIHIGPCRQVTARGTRYASKFVRENEGVGGFTFGAVQVVVYNREVEIASLNVIGNVAVKKQEIVKEQIRV